MNALAKRTCSSSAMGRRYLIRVIQVIRHRVEVLRQFLVKEGCCVLLCIKLLTVIGIFPEQTPKKGIVHSLRTANVRFVVITALYSIFVSSPVQIYASVARDSDLLEIIETLGLMFAFTKISNYVASFHLHQWRYRQMLSTLDEVQECGRQYDDRPKDILRRTQRLTQGACVYVAIGIVSTVFITFGQLPKLIASRRFHFKVWFPNKLLSSCYGVLLAGWVVFVVSSGVSMVSTGGLLIDLLGQAIGQIKLLRHNLKSIRRNAEAKSTALADAARLVGLATKDPHAGLDAANPFAFDELVSWIAQYNVMRDCVLDIEKSAQESVEHQMHLRIKQCVIHHQIVIRYAEELSRAFSMIFTHQLLSTLLPTAMGLILVTNAKEVDMKIVSYVILTFGGMTSFFVFCWLASEVTKESALVKEDMFGCDWMLATESFKRSMRIIISMSNKPIEFSSIFAPISMCTFREVLRVVYSYYMFVISTMRKDRQHRR